MDKAQIEVVFDDKDLHTSWQGAELNALQVIDGLQALPGNPFEQYLIAIAEYTLYMEAYLKCFKCCNKSR